MLSSIYQSVALCAGNTVQVKHFPDVPWGDTDFAGFHAAYLRFMAFQMLGNLIEFNSDFLPELA
jgi:hypothetical protein